MIVVHHRENIRGLLSLKAPVIRYEIEETSAIQLKIEVIDLQRKRLYCTLQKCKSYSDMCCQEETEYLIYKLNNRCINYYEMWKLIVRIGEGNK